MWKTWTVLKADALKVNARLTVARQHSSIA